MNTKNFQNSFFNIEEMVNSLPVFRIFGAQVEIIKSGLAHVNISKIIDIHTGGFQSTSINGMVIMGLLDSAICSAALSHLNGTHCATAEISVKFMKPVIGTEIKSIGEVVSRSKDLFFCKSQIINTAGQVCALATGIVKSM